MVQKTFSLPVFAGDYAVIVAPADIQSRITSTPWQL